MSSLDKLKELRQQLCKKKYEATVDCRQHILKELTSLHKGMAADKSVPDKYTQKVFELLDVLDMSPATAMEGENV